MRRKVRYASVGRKRDGLQVRCTSANCEMYHCEYQRSSHGIGMMNAQPKPNARVRHIICRPLAVNTTSRRVPAMLRQIQRIHAVSTQAQPMIVIPETIMNRYQPK